MKKPGRNDPCPCGSGKKHKQCCLRQAESPAASGHIDALSKAMEWISSRHSRAAREAINEYYFGALDDDQRDRIKDLPRQVYEGIMVNAMEWLLADGVIESKGEERKVSGLLLGRGGPALAADQRRWLEGLVAQPLRLYEILEVAPGEGALLKDALAPEQPPIRVREKSGSRNMAPYDLIAVRVIPCDQHHELSGAVYSMPRGRSWNLIDELRRELGDLRPEDPLAKEVTATIIPSRWLELLLSPPEIPDFVDAYTGQPILLVTDHYRVNDWNALAAALAARPDIEGDRDEGWERIFEDEDGQRRSSLAVNLGNKPDRIEVFYRTQRYADQGRPWLEALADSSISFLTREITDPKGAPANRMESNEPRQPSKAVNSLPPEAMTEVIQQYIHKVYADWADTPLEVLDDRTPRDMIGTSEGLERVKFLLRTYEHSEARQAEDQQREPVSYDFLWEALGIER
jgi:hypothetical protein